MNNKINSENHMGQIISQKRLLIEDWFAKQWQYDKTPIYGSVDIRNAGFKIAPIDMNLFPSGFNNLSTSCWPVAATATRKIIDQYQSCQRILIIAENHTRNLFYFENLTCLKHILELAGYSIRIGTFRTQPMNHNFPCGKTLSLEPIKRVDNRLMVEDFDPDIILLNNDLSAGIPDIVQNISQTIYPSLKLSWASRLKSQYFHHYNAIADEFSQLINMDSWFISPIFRQCSGVDFLKKEGKEELIALSREVIAKTQEKYNNHGIKKKPFIVIKANAGTYGMNVMMIHNPDDIGNLNRKKRIKMATMKGGQKATNFIIQEGIYSFDFCENQVAEPVMYLIGNRVIGGFYRIHQDKAYDENLNSPGMHFKPMLIKDSHYCFNQTESKLKINDQFYTQNVIARLAMLAAAKENEQVLCD